MSCALDQRGRAEQLQRFGRIGDHAIWSRRLPGELTVVLHPDLDDGLLDQTIAIETECCPFFGVIWDDDTRELTVLARPEHQPVLERVGDALELGAARL